MSLKSRLVSFLPTPLRSRLKRLRQDLTIRSTGMAEFDAILRKSHGVLHVGANMAQEAQFYARLGLKVVWLEAMPEFAAQCAQRISGLPNQHVLEALVSDKPDQKVTFHVTNNSGAASSMFELDQVDQIWPDVTKEREVELTSTTIDTLAADNPELFAGLDVAVLDIQGAELVALQGAQHVLGQLQALSVEVSEIPLYKGAATRSEIGTLLRMAGFKCIDTHRIGGDARGDMLDELWVRATDMHAL